MSKHIILAAFLLALLTQGCSKEEVIQDQERLDAILSRASSLTTETRRFEGTNIITHLMDSADSKRVLEALDETNRLVVDVWKKKRIARWIEFSKGTNFVSRISIFDDGILHFDHYNFKLKSPLEEQFLFPDGLFRLTGDQSSFEKGTN